MLDIIVCTVLMGLPNENEVCYIAESSVTEETFCETMEAMAVVRRHPLRVSYCRIAEELDHPEDVLRKLNRTRIAAGRRKDL